MFVPRTQFPQYRTTLAHFKGHHKKALDVFDKLRSQIHLIIHLKDARAPIATNSVPRSALKSTPVITVYSNKDRSSFKGEEGAVSLDARGSMTSLFKELKAFHNTLWPPPPLGLRMIIVGVPNIGKSTLINSMRAYKLGKKKVARTGLQAGTTRATSEVVRVFDEPEMLVYDTPGVLTPQVNRLEDLLQLYLIGSVMPSTDALGGVDPLIAVDYLLYIMNLVGPRCYVETLGLKTPTNNIEEVLEVIAKKGGMLNKNKEGVMVVDKIGASLKMVHMFRTGKFGKLVLDDNWALNKYQRRIERA